MMMVKYQWIEALQDGDGTDGSIVLHLINILGLRKKRLSVKVLDTISPEEISKNGWDRKDVSQQSEASVRAAMAEEAWWNLSRIKKSIVMRN